MLLREGDIIRIRISNTLVTEVTVKRITYAKLYAQPAKILEINAPNLDEGETSAEVTFYV